MGSGVPGKTPFAVARALSAAQRQAAREQRSPEEQLALLDGRPGNSRAERTRLEKRKEQ